MVLSDNDIRKLSRDFSLISPFVDSQYRPGVISYGLSSSGYDVRLAPRLLLASDPYGVLSQNEARKLVEPSQRIIDPKRNNAWAFQDEIPLNQDGSFEIPPHGFALGESVETIRMPDNLMAVCFGKSTYARCGLILNVTPLEPGWTGTITLEISNTTDLPARVYANEGIVQLVFHRLTKACGKSYAGKNGKYQNQHGITLPKS